MGLAKTYAKRMWDELSSLTTWQPDIQLSVGDIVMAGPGGTVTRETSLTELGVEAVKLPHAESVAAPLHAYDGVTFKADVNGHAGAYGNVDAGFSRESSFLVVTNQGVKDLVSNMLSARTLIQELNTTGDWNASWYLVTGVRRYPATTIVISKTEGVHVNLDVDVSAIADGAPHGIKAGAGVSVNNEHVSQWAMSFPSTPIFEAMRLKKRWVFGEMSAKQVEYLTRDLTEADYAESAAAEGVEAKQIEIPQMATAVDFGLV